MVDFTILAMTGDVDWLQYMQPDLQALGRTRVILAGSMDEACDLLDTSGARLVLVDWSPERVSCETLDRLLWANTTVSRPARVLVVSDNYRADLAVTLFQMGVDEYLSRAEHAGQLQAILSQLLSREPEAGHDLEQGVAASEPSSPVEEPQAKPARRIAVASSA
jgi:DNA-binding NarL/FixJ family response regulator